MSFEDFIEAAHRHGFADSYIDVKAREYGFFEGEVGKNDFAFHVCYGERFGRPTLMVEGKRNYFGLGLSGSSLDRGVSVNLITMIPANEMGRDARALQSALLKFPGFTSLEQSLDKWRS